MPKKGDVVTVKVLHDYAVVLPCLAAWLVFACTKLGVASALHIKALGSFTTHALLQVTKITPRLVGTDILCIGNKPLPDARFTGIIR